MEIKVSDTSPMTAAAIDLAKVGYREREFYVEGSAYIQPLFCDR